MYIHTYICMHADDGWAWPYTFPPIVYIQPVAVDWSGARGRVASSSLARASANASRCLRAASARGRGWGFGLGLGLGFGFGSGLRLG